MRRKRRLIGRIVAAYCAGRADARAGRRRRFSPLDHDEKDRDFYRQGVLDERHRMKLHRRLVQFEMSFMHPPDTVEADHADEPE